nr:MAG TPA: tail assembly chaperone protein [Caudoviricetes sp.]
MLGFSAPETWHMTPNQIAALYAEYTEFYNLGGENNGI